MAVSPIDIPLAAPTTESAVSFGTLLVKENSSKIFFNPFQVNGVLNKILLLPFAKMKSLLNTSVKPVNSATPLLVLLESVCFMRTFKKPALPPKLAMFKTMLWIEPALKPASASSEAK